MNGNDAPYRRPPEEPAKGGCVQEGTLGVVCAGMQFHPIWQRSDPLSPSLAAGRMILCGEGRGAKLVTLGPLQCPQRLGFVLSFNPSQLQLPHPSMWRSAHWEVSRGSGGILPRLHTRVSSLLFLRSLLFLQAALGWSPCGRSWPPFRAPTPGSCRCPQSAWPWTLTRWVSRLPRLLHSGLGRLTWVSPAGEGEQKGPFPNSLEWRWGRVSMGGGTAMGRAAECELGAGWV